MRNACACRIVRLRAHGGEDMKQLAILGSLLPSLGLMGLALAPALVVAAPGEDPVVLRGPVQYLSLPVGAAAKSQGLDTIKDMPVNMRAKIARYEAKAFAEDPSGIATDTDVTTRASSDGLRKTCVQEVGSNTAASGSGTTNAFNRYGPSPQAQVVVLRGDLVNICR